MGTGKLPGGYLLNSVFGLWFHFPRQTDWHVVCKANGADADIRVSDLQSGPGRSGSRSGLFLRLFRFCVGPDGEVCRNVCGPHNVQ
jgi:hypothetical protein